MTALVEPIQVGPGRWALPRLPENDDAALRRLAADCRELSAVLGDAGRDAHWVVAAARRDWSGRAAASVPRPLAQLCHDITVVRHALDSFADELDKLAAALAAADEAHGTSWRKVAAVSAVVAVTAGLVVVTVGSAGAATPGAAAAETAVVTAAAGEMAAAGAAAAAARTAAVEGLLLAARLVRAVQALRAIVVPRLVIGALRVQLWAETPVGAAAVAAGTTAASEYVHDGEVEPIDVAFAALLGAGEAYGLAPGRGRYRDLTPRRIATMERPSYRRRLIAINRSASPQGQRAFTTTARQLKTHHKHADVFGVSTHYNRETSDEFKRAMETFIGNSDTVRIVGSYKGRPAILYANYDSRQVVLCRQDGAFWTTMKVRGRQWWHVWHDGELGGG